MKTRTDLENIIVRGGPGLKVLNNFGLLALFEQSKADGAVSRRFIHCCRLLYYRRRVEQLPLHAEMKRRETRGEQFPKAFFKGARLLLGWQQ